MLETDHAAMRTWLLISHESFGHVLMLDSYMHACDWSMVTIGLHGPTGCFTSVGKVFQADFEEEKKMWPMWPCGSGANRPHGCANLKVIKIKRAKKSKKNLGRTRTRAHIH